MLGTAAQKLTTLKASSPDCNNQSLQTCACVSVTAAARALVACKCNALFTDALLFVSSSSQEVMETDDVPDPRIAVYDQVLQLYNEARQLVYSTHIAGDQASALKVRQQCGLLQQQLSSPLRHRLEPTTALLN